MNKIIIVLLIAGFSTTVNAFSGADLLAQCKHFVGIIDGNRSDSQGILLAGQCGGYVLGVQEGFIASSELADVVSEETGTPKVTKKHWEIPSDVEPESIVRIVVRYLEINPDMHSMPAVLSVLNALRQTYPVKQ
jgi:hypothetical protein